MSSAENSAESWPEPEAVSDMVAAEMETYGRRFPDNAKLDAVTAEELAEAREKCIEAITCLRSIARRQQSDAGHIAGKPMAAQRAAENMTPLVGYGQPGKVSSVVRLVKASGAEASVEIEARNDLHHEVGARTLQLERDVYALFDVAGTLAARAEVHNTRGAEFQRKAQRAAEDV